MLCRVMYMQQPRLLASACVPALRLRVGLVGSGGWGHHVDSRKDGAEREVDHEHDVHTSTRARRGAAAAGDGTSHRANRGRLRTPVQRYTLTDFTHNPLHPLTQDSSQVQVRALQSPGLPHAHKTHSPASPMHVWAAAWAALRCQQCVSVVRAFVTPQRPRGGHLDPWRVPSQLQDAAHLPRCLQHVQTLAELFAGRADLSLLVLCCCNCKYTQ